MKLRLEVRMQIRIMIPAGIMFVGGLLLLFTSFMKLKNYRTEQPDENIR